MPRLRCVQEGTWTSISYLEVTIVETEAFAGGKFFEKISFGD